MPQIGEQLLEQLVLRWDCDALLKDRIMDQVMLTVAQFCRSYGIGKTKCYELIENGELVKAKIGRRTLITVESAERLVRRSIGDDK